jgi:sortase A
LRRAVGWVCLGTGLALLLGIVAWWHLQDTRTAQAQARLGTELRTELPARPPAVRSAALRHAAPPVARGVPPGHALAVLTIPRFGADWRWVTVEGTTADDLAEGPGHYAGTPLPGARGNVAFAGHRAGHGDPFIDFDRLRPGDVVTFEQAGTRWVYTLDTSPVIVGTGATWVLDPLPGRHLTLTTCWPRYGSAQRMYVRGHLTSVRG